MLFEVFAIFETFAGEESKPKRRSKREENQRELAHFQGCGAQRHRHRQARREQQHGINRTIDDPGMLAGNAECLIIEAAVDGIAAEQGAEEQKLARQEDPHAEPNALALQPKIGPRFAQRLRSAAHICLPCGRARASPPISSLRPKS